jgi:galactose mutarotase-like enzyme
MNRTESLFTISNQSVTAAFSATGAELTSLKDSDGEEFIWYGDALYWGYHAPLLFPIVGRLKDDTLKLAGQSYHLAKHGFARVSEFSVIEYGPDRITFHLESSEATLKIYPFRFDLEVRYELSGACLNVNYQVTNLDHQTISFSIGAHPAFRVPRSGQEQFSDYYLEFAQPEDLIQMQVLASGLFSREFVPFGLGIQRIDLTKGLFVNDALVFTQLKQNSISLKSRKNAKSVNFDFPGFPVFAIWSKADESPFVCLEPWFGHADFEDFSSNFSEKPGNIRLDVDETFQCGYSIRLG